MLASSAGPQRGNTNRETFTRVCPSPQLWNLRGPRDTGWVMGWAYVGRILGDRSMQKNRGGRVESQLSILEELSHGPVLTLLQSSRTSLNHDNQIRHSSLQKSRRPRGAGWYGPHPYDCLGSVPRGRGLGLLAVVRVRSGLCLLSSRHCRG